MVPLLLRDGGRKVLKLICGIFLTITVLRPLPGMSPDRFLDQLLPRMEEADAAVQSGVTMAEESLAGIITDRCEAYILDKAAALGLSLNAAVSVSEGEWPLPVAVKLTGPVTDEKRRQLSGIIARDLGIPEEEQQWIG